jgi:3-oxoacyl-[acyl-carrier protein] reductase
VNNAGVSLISSVFSDEESFVNNWDQTIAINVSAHAHMIRAALPYLQKAPNGGRVVNIASTEAIVATGGLSAYTASKHAVIGLTKSIDTAMTSGINDEAKEKYAKRKVPLRRYGVPEEVAHMTLNLCMPASSFVNGSSVVVDGGMSVKHG